MALDWLPIYPARVGEPVLLSAAYQQHYAGAARGIPRLSEWDPTYPDRIVRKVLPAALRQSFFAPGDDRPALPAPELSWTSVYPDRLVRKASPRLSASFSVPFSRATSLDVFPTYPDRVVRRTMLAATQLTEGLKLEGIPPFLSWKGEQPSIVWPTRSLRPAAQLHYQFYAEPVPDPPPPGLGYETAIYPDRLYRTRSVPLPSRQTFAVNIVPIPNPPPPTDYTWLPPAEVPIVAPSRRLHLDRPQLVEAFGVPSLLSWLPSWPQPHTRPQPPSVAHVSGLLGALLAIPITGSWRPHFPDRLWRPINPNDFSGFDPVSVAALLPVPPECIEWMAEAFDVTGITDQDSTRAGIIDEDSTGPGLGGPKAC